MAAFIKENTQFLDSNGDPLTGGEIYIGTVNLDPVLNPITIYSDRDLTSVLANPQTLDSLGKSTNKIWIPAKYSFKTLDVDGNQVEQSLDNGEEAGTESVILINVVGSDAITADASPAITTLVDKTQVILQAVGSNAGNMTLAIGTIPAKSILMNVDQEIPAGRVQDNQSLVFVWNEGLDVFEWVNHSDKIINATKADDIASNTTTDIWSSLGNYVDITTNVTPITSLGTAPRAGMFMFLKFDGVVTLTHGASLICPGGKDLITAAGDTCIVYADSTTIARISHFQKFIEPPSQSGWRFSGSIDLTTGSPTSVTLLSSLVDVNTIIINVSGFSTDTASTTAIIRIGDSGGIESTGYASTGWSVKSTPSLDDDSSTSGFLVSDNLEMSAARDIDFTATLTHLGSNLWSFTTIGAISTGTMAHGQGKKTLSGKLTQVSITTEAGTATLDGGTAHARSK